MSPSILERHTPFPETNWRVIQTETRHGVSEESIQKHLVASSTRSENEKPAGVFSPMEECAYCSGMHDSSNCKYHLSVKSLLEKKGAPKVASTEECRICHDKHDSYDCDRTDLMFPSYADDQENGVDTPIQECEFCFGNHDPADCELQYLISEPDNEYQSPHRRMKYG